MPRGPLPVRARRPPGRRRLLARGAPSEEAGEGAGPGGTGPPPTAPAGHRRTEEGTRIAASSSPPPSPRGGRRRPTPPSAPAGAARPVPGAGPLLKPDPARPEVAALRLLPPQADRQERAVGVKVLRGYWCASVSCGRNKRACCRAAATGSSPFAAFTCANFQMPHVSVRAKSVSSFTRLHGCHISHRPHTRIKIKAYGSATMLMPTSAA